MTVSHAAHASLLVVAGVEYRVRRDFELCRRVEERFGPLLGLGERMEKHQFTMAELVDLYVLMLSGHLDPPPVAVIQQHAVDVGISRANAELYKIAMAFFMGEERFMKTVADQLKGAPAHPRMAPPGSPGASLSGPPLVSAGHRRTSGDPHSTN